MRASAACALLMLCTVPAIAGNPPRPKWMGNVPSGTAGFYFVEAHTDASSSLDGARTASLKELAAGAERTDAVRVNEVFTDQSAQTYTNGKVSFQGVDTYNLELQVAGEAEPIHSRRVDEYWRTVKRGGIPVLEYTALYAVERKGQKADFSGIRVGSSYGMGSMWRSFIVPGWGQLYKRNTFKGGLMMGGTAALVAGIIVTEKTRSDYVSFMHNTHDASFIHTYNTKAKNFATARNVCIGAAAALYVWNVVDALASPGAKYVTVTSSGIGFSKKF